MPTPESNSWRLWRLRLRHAVIMLVFALARRPARIVLVVGAVALALYLLYLRAWLPLQQTAPLPPGVVATPLEVDQVLLQEINNDRLERVGTPPRPFTTAGRLLVPATPLPVVP